MMAKFKVEGFKKMKKGLQQKIRTAVKKTLRDPNVRNDIGDIAAKSIKATNFGSPAEGTVKWRKKYARFQKLDKAYKPSQLRMVITGELLQDLKKNVKANPITGEFVIDQSDKLHKKYKKKRGTIGKKRSKYSDIKKGLYKLGYEYLTFNDVTLQRMSKRIKRALRGLLF